MTSFELPEPIYGEWNIGGFPIRWMQWGAGKPDIIGLHGFAASTRTWHLIAPHIVAGGRTLLSIGLPYHNGSDPLVQPNLNIVRYAEALTGILRAFDIQKAPVIAHSFGCRVLCAAAIHDPNLFSHLLMVAPGGFHPKEDLLFSLFRKQPFLYALRREWLMKKGMMRIAPDSNPEKLVQMGLIFEKLALSYPYTSPKALGLLPLLSAYSGKTTLIMGTDDTILPFSYHKRIEQYFSNAVTEPVEGGGHVPMLRKPDLLYAILRARLEWD